ncbi:UNVERIFIED_CONTAM: hypothetical protein PYX00_011655 [Menopon gallinae]|uniref:Uncharacterized protein n=1 Tax=Menopon gallinae TaxID=328185 RepID=A0AAW2H8W1_9NEOP
MRTADPNAMESRKSLDLSNKNLVFLLVDVCVSLQLVVLLLNGNQLANKLVSFPTSIGSMVQLKELSLNNNKLALFQKRSAACEACHEMPAAEPLTGPSGDSEKSPWITCLNTSPVRRGPWHLKEHTLAQRADVARRMRMETVYGINPDAFTGRRMYSRSIPPTKECL